MKKVTRFRNDKLHIGTGNKPSCLEFPHYNKIFSLIQVAFSYLLPYLNIYPSYAVKGSNTDVEILTQLQYDTYNSISCVLNYSYPYKKLHAPNRALP